MPTTVEVLAQERRIAEHRMRRARALAKLIHTDLLIMLRTLEPDDWQNMAVKAEINAQKPPSEETIGMTLELVKDWIR